jgi:hypothetical protein
MFQADVDHEELEEAINAAYPKKSAYLGPVGQRLQKGGVKRVESYRSDGSGATFMSSGTQESGGSNGSTTTGYGVPALTDLMSPFMASLTVSSV